MHPMAWKESLRDRWILSNRPPSELRFIYCDLDYWGDSAIKWTGLRQYRKNHRESLRLLMGTQPPGGEYLGPENERERVKKQRQRVAPKTGGAALKLMAFSVPEEHLRYHEALQEALKENGSVDKARFSDWQSLTKDADGEAQIHDLHGARFEVTFENEPLWKPIAPVELKRPLRRTKSPEKRLTEYETTIIAPDIQFPFVDEKALDVFYQITASLKPDNIVQLGDALDLTAYSRFLNSPEFANNTQLALGQTLEFFATLRQLSPAAKIVYLEGNHELRLPKDIMGNHRANWGIRPADDTKGFPLISVPRMAGLESVDVEYLAGYPNNRFWINDRLQIIHGNTTGKNEGKRIMHAEKISTIYGHTHRLNHDMQTVNERDKASYRHSFGAGSLCRLDTHVPGYHTGYDLDGDPVGNHQENWQHGFLVVTHDKGSFHVEQVVVDTFNGYRTLFRGRIYEPRTR